MKIGIIGGGISGLSAAYKLQNKGFDCILFEESGYTGGRFEHAVKVIHPEFHESFFELIEDLDLEDALVDFRGMEMLAEGNIVPFNGFTDCLSYFSDFDRSKYSKMEEEALKSHFDPFSPSGKLLALREISLADYLDGCSEEFINQVIHPLVSLTFMDPIDISKISAEYGLFKFRLISEFSRPNAKVFAKDEGIKVVTNVLERKARQKGVEFNLSSKVVTVEDGVISYERAGKSGKKEVDLVVLAIPTGAIEKIIPHFSCNEVFYESTKYYSLDGEYKPERDILFSRADEKNMKVSFDVYHKEQQVFPNDMNKEVDFSALYKGEPMLLEETVEENPFPVIKPKANLPETMIGDGIYICGDYFYYPYIETAIATTERVVNEIENNY